MNSDELKTQQALLEVKYRQQAVTANITGKTK